MARFRPDQPRDAVAHLHRFVHPACFVPPPDQHLAPFGLHRMRHARGGSFGQGAQRIAIQIDHAFGQMEHGFGGGEVDGHGVLLQGRGGGAKITPIHTPQHWNFKLEIVLPRNRFHTGRPALLVWPIANGQPLMF